MVPEGWHNYRLPAILLEEHKNEPVDTNAGLRALIAYDLSPWKFQMHMIIHSKDQVGHGIDQTQIRRRTYRRKHLLSQVYQSQSCECKG